MYKCVCATLAMLTELFIKSIHLVQIAKYKGMGLQWNGNLLKLSAQMYLIYADLNRPNFGWILFWDWLELNWLHYIS